MNVCAIIIISLNLLIYENSLEFKSLQSIKKVIKYRKWKVFAVHDAFAVLQDNQKTVTTNVSASVQVL